MSLCGISNPTQIGRTTVMEQTAVRNLLDKLYGTTLFRLATTGSGSQAARALSIRVAVAVWKTALLQIPDSAEKEP